MDNNITLKPVYHKEMTNLSDEWEKMLDDFLVILYQKSPKSDNKTSYFARGDIATELGFTFTQTNNIVKELIKRGYVAQSNTIGKKITITNYGKNYVRDLELDKQ